MEFNSYIGLDVHKETIAVAIADAGRDGEVRFYGEIANTPDAVGSLLKKLGGRHGKLHFVYEAGPCGYGLYRQIVTAGHACEVVSPAHTPRRTGDHVKTDRRDAVMLARLSRAGDLRGSDRGSPTTKAPYAVSNPRMRNGSTVTPNNMQRLLERVEHEARMHRARGAPFDDPPREGVDHESLIDEALPNGDINEIRKPQSIRARRLEISVRLVERA
ncbi:hypothetical protein Ms3S1_16460 [Methylosinus sp. 3S-1]